MNELTKKVSLLGTGLVIGATTFTAIGASAHPGGDVPAHQAPGVVVSEVLGLSKDELKDAKDSGQSFEEIVASNGFESLEAFETEVESALRTTLAEQGLSEEEIDKQIVQHQEHRKLRQDIEAAHQSLLGLSREEVKAKLDGGMTMDEILAAAGFDSKDALHEAIAESLAQTWADEGVSQEEIDGRLERLKDHKPGHRRGLHGSFMHHNRFEDHDSSSENTGLEKQ